MIQFSAFTNRALCMLIIVVLIFTVGCSQSSTQTATAPSKANETPRKTNDTSNKAAEASNQVKKMPDQVTKVKAGITSGLNASYLPWVVAQKKDMFKKYNLDVEFVSVDGTAGVRGLSTGELQFLAGLSESIVTSVSEGANIKLIGAMMSKSISLIIASPDIKKPEDLKGKIIGGYQQGSGVDALLRWWLKTKGIDPDKDVRIVSAGGNAQRVQALKLGKAHMTILSPPLSLILEKEGFNRIGLLRDDLPKQYNHSVISANSNLLKERPEVARAIMAATADAVDFIRDASKRKEVIEIGKEALKSNEEDFTYSLDFALPAFADNGKIDVGGVEFAIDSNKELGNLKKNVSVSDVLDESYYRK